MVEPAHILFEDNGPEEFALGCGTGHIWAASDTEAMSIDCSWDGNDETDQVNGDGSAQLQPDGSLHHETRHHNRNEYPFIAQKSTSSNAS